MNTLADTLEGSSAAEEPLVDLDEMMLTGILFNESELMSTASLNGSSFGTPIFRTLPYL